MHCLCYSVLLLLNVICSKISYIATGLSFLATSSTIASDASVIAAWNCLVSVYLWLSVYLVWKFCISYWQVYNLNSVYHRHASFGEKYLRSLHLQQPKNRLCLLDDPRKFFPVHPMFYKYLQLCTCSLFQNDATLSNAPLTSQM